MSRSQNGSAPVKVEQTKLQAAMGVPTFANKDAAARAAAAAGNGGSNLTPFGITPPSGVVLAKGDIETLTGKMPDLVAAYEKNIDTAATNALGDPNKVVLKKTKSGTDITWVELALTDSEGEKWGFKTQLGNFQPNSTHPFFQLDINCLDSSTGIGTTLRVDYNSVIAVMAL